MHCNRPKIVPASVDDWWFGIIPGSVSNFNGATSNVQLQTINCTWGRWTVESEIYVMMLFFWCVICWMSWVLPDPLVFQMDMVLGGRNITQTFECSIGIGWNPYCSCQESCRLATGLSSEVDIYTVYTVYYKYSTGPTKQLLSHLSDTALVSPSVLVFQ